MTIRATDLLAELPKTTSDLASHFGIGPSTVRDHFATLKARGYEFDHDEEGRRVLVSDAKVVTEPTNYAAEFPEGSSARTRELNEHFSDLKSRLNKLLAASEPAIADGGQNPTPDAEDVVIFRTDSHFGDSERDEHGRVTFNHHIAQAREEHITDEVMALTERQERAGSVFDTAHLLLGGDIVTGEGIYDGQPWETDLPVDKQIDLAVDVFFDQIRRLSERFPTVQVVCVPGNHGELRVSDASGGANADLFVYGFLDMLVRQSDMTNVTFIRNESTSFCNFPLRDGLWQGHLRHGQDSLSHVGTTSGIARWGAWQRNHQFDIGYRGHYHEVKVERLDAIPIIEGGSISPPGEFAEKLGYGGSRPAAVIHGVSDTRVMSWLYPIDFADADDDFGPDGVPDVDPAAATEVGA